MNPKWPVVSSFNHGWSREILPALRVESGATVQIKALDASGGQFSSSSTSADIAKLNFERVNPVTGPIFIEGAMPGDAIRVNCWSSSHQVGVGRASFRVLVCYQMNSVIRT